MLPHVDEMAPISQGTSGRHVLRCASRYIVRHMNSAFPADILHLQVAEHGADARVVTVTGEVDALTAPQLADVLTAQLAVARVVVVDLDAVQFMASAGLRVLFEIDELATRQDRCLRLVSNSPTVTLVLETSGLRDQFTVANNVADALRSKP
jgi:anti-sigma B factor antagonist